MVRNFTSCWRIRCGAERAETLSLTGRKITLTFPDPVSAGDRAWISSTRQGIYSPLGDGSGSPHGKAVEFFVSETVNQTTTIVEPTVDPVINVADGTEPRAPTSLVDFSGHPRQDDDDDEDGRGRLRADRRHGRRRRGLDARRWAAEPTAGDTRQSIYVPVINDDNEDSGETVRLEFSIRSNATIGDGRATGCIYDVDPPVEQPDLTASFENMPSEHDGETVFHLPPVLQRRLRGQLPRPARPGVQRVRGRGHEGPAR